MSLSVKSRRELNKPKPIHLPAIQELTQEEGKALFDRAARYYLNMSGEDFLCKWEAGEFADNPDQPDVIQVAMLIPFAK